MRGLNRVLGIQDIKFQLPTDVFNFIEYLNDYGTNRYLIHPTHLLDRSLLELDRSIWYVRRYCYYMGGPTKRRSGIEVSRLEYEVKKIHHLEYESNPQKFRIFGGYLERMLDRNSLAAKQLVWKNFYFGRRKKRKVRNYRFRMSSTNPTHFLHPEVFWELEKLVDFPSGLRAHFLKSSG